MNNAATTDTKLFITEFSPYARMTRILCREKGLLSRVEEVIARTREVNSPYYKINFSGRVPYLLRSDGIGIAGSRLILEFLDQLQEDRLLHQPDKKSYWEYGRLEESALVVMDGVSVWCRELKRPASDRSQIIIEHETARAARMVAQWDREIDNPIMRGPLNFPQLTLACALCLDQWNPNFQWRDKHPKLLDWLTPMETKSSFLATNPPSKISIDPPIA